jgi:hypothetical protein
MVQDGERQANPTPPCATRRGDGARCVPGR